MWLWLLWYYGVLASIGTDSGVDNGVDGGGGTNNEVGGGGGGRADVSCLFEWTSFGMEWWWFCGKIWKSVYG